MNQMMDEIFFVEFQRREKRKAFIMIMKD